MEPAEKQLSWKERRKEHQNKWKEAKGKGKGKAKGETGARPASSGGRGGQSPASSGGRGGQSLQSTNSSPHSSGGRNHGQARASSNRGSDARGKDGQLRDSRARPLADVLDYLRTCSRTLGEGLGSQEEEVLLASRALEEMGDRVLLVAADQRGSRPLERLLRKAGNEAFAAMFNTLMQAVPELAPNQYASHVIQSALASWAARLETVDPPPAAPLVALCESLQEDGGWPALIHDPCGSHVVRALILALGGYAPGQENRDRAASKAGLLPEKRSDVPSELVECRRSVATTFISLVREDSGLALNENASPVMQMVLRVLRDRGVRSLLSELTSAIIGVKRGVLSTDKVEGLVQSAPGSRLLEAVLETCSAETFALLFSKFFRARLSALVKGEAGDFGAFLAQRVADALRDEPQLMLALAEVDFSACLKSDATSAQQAVAVKFAEACLRLRAGLKACAAEIFRSLNLRESTEYHRVWPTLLALEHTDTPSALLRPVKSGGQNSGTSPPPTVKFLPAAGPQLLSALLRFPADAVQPLNSGLPKFLENREVLVACACGAKTARILEGALAPASALLPRLRARLARSFKGALGGLGPHPVGGWVCAALWRASLGDHSLREAFAQELLVVEEALRAHNFAVWKVCGLHQAKTRKEEWSEQQQKAGKSKRLFDDLLKDADPEAAKAAALARERAAEDAADRDAKAALRSDPLVAGLLPADLAASTADDEDIGLMLKGEGEGEDAEPEEPDDAELDDLFAPKRNRWGRINAEKESSASGLPESTVSAGSHKAKAVPADSSLSEALQLIAGKGPAKLSKKQKRAAVASKPQDGEMSDDSADDVVKPPPSVEVVASGTPKLRKKKLKKKRAAVVPEPVAETEQGASTKRLKKRRRTTAS